MDLHYFQNSGCLAVVSRDTVLFIRETGVRQHTLGAEFASGIDCVSFDDLHSRIAISAKRNILILSVPSSESEPLIQSSALLERNCSTLAWSPSGSELVVGDKSGGIWTVITKTDVNEANNASYEPKAVGSRVAVVLALSLCGSENSKFLAVGDRDGRLSIFHYPATHNLHQVCLGHSQYIAALGVPNAQHWPNYLLSLGGDGLVNLWNMQTGLCAASVSLFDENAHVLAQNRPKSLLKINSKGLTSTWLVVGEDSASLYAFSLKGNEAGTEFEMAVEDVPALFSDFGSFEDTICSVATVADASVIFVTGRAGKSNWPWKEFKIKALGNSDSSLAPTFVEKLKLYLAANSLSNSFNLRLPREWLERHPHHNVAEYMKRKKAKFDKLQNKAAGVQEAGNQSESDSSDDDE